MGYKIKIELVNDNIDDLLDQSVFIVDLDIHSFDYLKNLIKEVYTGSTRITNNDIGLYFNNKPLLDFPPLEHKSFYGLMDESPLIDMATISEILTEEEDMPCAKLDLLINVDGFFRDYEPVYTDGLLRSEGHGLFSAILNTNYDQILKEGISATSPQINNIISERSIQKEPEENTASTYFPEIITPKITFIDSKTKNRIKVLSDINSSELVLVEIENYNNTGELQRGYLPKSKFDEISTFYMTISPKSSMEKKEIEIDKSMINEVLAFKFNTMYIKESFLASNGIKTTTWLKKNDPFEYSVTNKGDVYDIYGQQLEDLRTIFDPRGPITEVCLNFFSVIFKIFYLVIKHSILALIVLFNLANFIPTRYALGLTVCNFIYTLFSDKEIKIVWSEYLKSYKMSDIEYNEIISMVRNKEEIPIYVVLQLHDNQFVKDQISDYLRKTKAFSEVEALYNLVKNEKSMDGTNLQDIKDFIKTNQLPYSIVRYPYKTVDVKTRTMTVEPWWQGPVLDEFVNNFFRIMKQRLDDACSDRMRDVSSEDPAYAADRMREVALDLFGRDHNLCVSFQKPLYKVLIESVNFWKVNNFHLKPSTIARWRVDFDEPETKNSIELEMKRIDTDLNDMVHTIATVRKAPHKYVPIKNGNLIKDPFFSLDKYGNVTVCDITDLAFELEDGKLKLLENQKLQHRTLDEYLSSNTIAPFIRAIGCSPFEAVLLLIKETWALLTFLLSFRFSTRQEWIDATKRFILDGDIVYRYLPVYWYQNRITFFIPCYFSLFFLTLIPAYQEKLSVVMSERDVLLDQVNKEIKQYWETVDMNEKILKQKELERVQQEKLKEHEDEIVEEIPSEESSDE